MKKGATIFTVNLKKCQCRTGSIQVNKFLCLSILLLWHPKKGTKSDYCIGGIKALYHSPPQRLLLGTPVTPAIARGTMGRGKRASHRPSRAFLSSLSPASLRHKEASVKDRHFTVSQTDIPPL